MSTINKDNATYLVLTGSKSDLPPYQGKWNSQQHFLLNTLDAFTTLHQEGINVRHKRVTDLAKMKLNGTDVLVVGTANETIKFYSY